MNIKSAILGLALMAPVSFYSADASAFAKCDNMDAGKKQDKCNAKEAKKVTKLRAKTTALKPSAINAGLSGLDGDDVNPLNTDELYTPAYEPFNIEAVDQVLGGVNRIDAALTMAGYIGELNKAGKTDEAKKLATALLPELVKMKDDIKGIKEDIDKIKADPASLAKENPMAVPKIVGGATQALAAIPGMISGLPKAVSAIKPLAGGAAGAAVNAAVDKAGDAAGDVKDKVPEVPSK
jgi:hypothetical protein